MVLFPVTDKHVSYPMQLLQSKLEVVRKELTTAEANRLKILEDVDVNQRIIDHMRARKEELELAIKAIDV